jgi:hypothetical protein
VTIARFGQALCLLGIVNRAATPEPHDYQTDNAAMSTLMRTLRNLRKVGFKVLHFYSVH